MTCNNLIKQLQKLPQNYEVKFEDCIDDNVELSYFIEGINCDNISKTIYLY